MHYGDKEHIKEASLTMVVYKHTDLQKGGYISEITSIQFCQYFSIHMLKDLDDNLEKLFKLKLKKLKPEKFYGVLIRLKKVKRKIVFEWVGSNEITDKDIAYKPLLTLHE
jgi:hypothetical protein